jgi:hypothetical protein
MHGLANSSCTSRASAASLLAATTPVGRPCITCGTQQAHTQGANRELVSQVAQSNISQASEDRSTAAAAAATPSASLCKWEGLLVLH